MVHVIGSWASILPLSLYFYMYLYVHRDSYLRLHTNPLKLAFEGFACSCQNIGMLQSSPKIPETPMHVPFPLQC